MGKTTQGWRRKKGGLLAVDDFGSVIVTGPSWGWYNTTSDDFVTMKYKQHNYCTQQLNSDLDDDCQVNLTDFAVLSNDWFNSFGSEDLVILANEWLECNFALQEDCW